MQAAPRIRLINQNLEYLGYVSNYESLQFERRLWEIGSFELHVDLNDPGADILAQDTILLLGPEKAGIIDGIKDTESDKGLQRVVTGRQLKSIVARRVTVPNAVSDQSHFGYDRFPAADVEDAHAESVILTIFLIIVV